MTIGYVGLGAMGRALAGRLAVTCELVVWDLDPDAMARLAAVGARPADSANALAEACDVIFLCLPKSDAVDRLLFGEGGIASALRPGAIVVDQTSGVPERARDFASRLDAHGVGMIDAPVSGGVPSAEAGQITVIASGPDTAYARVEPHLRSISPKVFRCSPSHGDGHALKAINNVMNAACRMMTLEMVAIGRAVGLSTAALTDRLRAGPARSFVTDRLLPAVAEGRSSTDFALGLMVKDLNQALAIAAKANVATPLSDTARGMIHIGYNVLGEESRLDDIVSFMETVTGQKYTGNVGDRPMREDAGDTADLIEACMADANRLIARENAAVATGWGLALPDFAPVLLSGSAGSAAADRLFADMEGVPGGGPDVMGALKRFTRLTQLGAAVGVPMLMANQLRTLLIDRAANQSGETLR